MAESGGQGPSRSPNLLARGGLGQPRQRLCGLLPAVCRRPGAALDRPGECLAEPFLLVFEASDAR
jgi:hypothetical protein